MAISYKYMYFYSALLLIGLTAISYSAPKLSDFKRSSSVWVSSIEAQIDYNREETFSLNSQTHLQMHIPDGTWVQEGSIIATVNPENLEREEAKYNLELSQHNINKQEFYEEIDEQWLQMISQKKELKNDIQNLKLLLKEELSNTNKLKVKTAIERATESLSRLEIKSSEERKQLKISNFDTEKTLALKKIESELDILRLRSEIRAPFECQLQYLSEEISLDQAVWIKQVEDLFSMRDTRKIIVTCTPNLYTLAGIPPEDISLTIASIGAPLQATFLEEKHIRLGTQKSLSWKFQISDTENARANELIGTSQIANLYLNLKQESHIIPKTKIATLHPSVLEKTGWDGLIEKIWPASELVYISPRFIVVSQKKH